MIVELFLLPLISNRLADSLPGPVKRFALILHCMHPLPKQALVAVIGRNRPNDDINAPVESNALIVIWGLSGSSFIPII